MTDNHCYSLNVYGCKTQDDCMFVIDPHPLIHDESWPDMTNKLDTAVLKVFSNTSFPIHYGEVSSNCYQVCVCVCVCVVCRCCVCVRVWGVWSVCVGCVGVCGDVVCRCCVCTCVGCVGCVECVWGVCGCVWGCCV